MGSNCERRKPACPREKRVGFIATMVSHFEKSGLGESEEPAPSGEAVAPVPGSSCDMPLSVKAFDANVKSRIETTFGAKGVWVQGEIRDCAASKTGHMYFTLRDPLAPDCLRCSIWATSNVSREDRAIIANGAQVAVHGKASLFAAKSEVQLIVDGVRAHGRGALLEARERLKAKLESEGLFSAKRKRALPTDPRVVGIVTSATGAVVHDVRKVAFARGGARLLLAPTLVQGPAAANAIIEALAMLSAVVEVDVIILGRGGGSAEDLAAFDDERVVRAVAFCTKPVVTAVGHESDVTLVDFASDFRAATPSQAAEVCIPSALHRRERHVDLKRRLWRGHKEAMKAAQQSLGQVFASLERVTERVREGERLLDAQEGAMRQHVDHLLRRERRHVDDLTTRLHAQHPATRLASQQRRAHELEVRLFRLAERMLPPRRDALSAADGAAIALVQRALMGRRERLAKAAGQLHALSPLAILSRGFSLVTTPDGRAVRSVKNAPVGTQVTIRAADATFTARIEAAGEPESP